VFLYTRARRVGDPKYRAGLQVAGMMGRIWVVALAVILARVTGGRDDGIMAAALLLAAFTVYFVMSFITRDGPLAGVRGHAPESDPPHEPARAWISSTEAGARGR